MISLPIPSLREKRHPRTVEVDICRSGIGLLDGNRSDDPVQLDVLLPFVKADHLGDPLVVDLMDFLHQLSWLYREDEGSNA